MGAGISVDLGPPRRPAAAIGLDPWDGERLVLRHRPPLGCLGAAAAVVALAVAWVGAPGEPWGPPVVATLAALVLFGRRWQVVDRRRRVVEHGVGAVVPWWWRRRDLARPAAVVVEERRAASEEGTTTLFPVELVGTGPTVVVGRAGVWEEAVALGEVLAHFLRLPLEDRVRKATRRYDELERPLVDQPAEGGRPARRSREGATRRPRPMFSETRGKDGVLRIGVPQPRDHSYLALSLLVLVLWTLPVSLFGSPWFGLLPLAVMLASWVKVAYGFSAELTVSPGGLEVLARGLVRRRRVSIPPAELEDLVLHDLESGGPRNAVAMLFDGVLVARSDRAAVRFGYGLDRPELERLRDLILAELRGRRSESGPREVPRFEVPVLSRPLAPVLGLAVGAAAAAVAGGRLGVGVDLPVLGHLLNAGGLLGLLAGVVLHGLGVDRRSGARPGLLALGLGAALGAAYVLTAPHGPGLAPTADPGEELRLLGEAEARGDLRFLVGWVPVGTMALALGLAVVGLAVRGVGALLRRGLPLVARSGHSWRLAGALVAMAAALVAAVLLGGGLRGSPSPETEPAVERPVARTRASPPAATGAGGARAPGRLDPPLEAPPLPLEAVPEPAEVEARASEHAGFRTVRFADGVRLGQLLDLADGGGTLWVGTERGLLRWRDGDRRARLYGSASGLPGERLDSLVLAGERVAASVALATRPGYATGLGVFLFDPARRQWQRLDGGGDPLAWDGARLWVASQALRLVDPAGGPAQVHSTDSGLLHDRVGAVAVGPDEAWVAMYGSWIEGARDFSGGGVSRLDRRTGAWTSFTTRDGLARSYCCALAVDRREVWVAHWEEELGLSVLDRSSGGWRVVRTSREGTPVGGVCLALDGDGLWVGQQGGLLHLDRRTLSATVYREGDGLPGYIVSGIAVGTDAVWASVYGYGGGGAVRDAGLVRVPREERVDHNAGGA